MRRIIYLSIVLLSAPMATVSQDSLQQSMQEIESMVEQYASEHNVPAINLGVVIDGQTYFINYGVSNREEKKPTSEHSIFQIASLGKVLTGIVANSFIMKGDLKKDESISSYLPESYSKSIKNKMTEITVRDLLHHRSGLPRQSEIINRKNDEPIIYDYKEEDFEKDLKQMKTKSMGEFKYSNFGYALLSHIVELSCNRSFEELLVEQFEGYGLSVTSTYCKDKDLLVTPYDEDDRNLPTKNWEMGKLAPPSGIYSSVADLTKLLKVQLKAYNKNDLDNVLYITSDTREAWSGTGISYGYGMFDWGNGGYGHGGGMDGYGGEYWLHPEENVGFVLLTSSGGKWINQFSRELNKILIDLPGTE